MSFGCLFFLVKKKKKGLKRCGGVAQALPLLQTAKHSHKPYSLWLQQEEEANVRGNPQLSTSLKVNPEAAHVEGGKEALKLGCSFRQWGSLHPDQMYVSLCENTKLAEVFLCSSDTEFDL